MRSVYTRCVAALAACLLAVGWGTTTHADAAEVKPFRAERNFVMPEGVEYAPDVALIRVDPGSDPSEVTAALERSDGVVAHEVSAEEVASGLIEVEVAQGASVEDAVNGLIDGAAEVSLGAQPDYVYYPLGWWTEGRLRATLAAATGFEVADPQIPLPEDEGEEADRADTVGEQTAEDGSPVEAEGEGDQTEADLSLTEPEAQEGEEGVEDEDAADIPDDTADDARDLPEEDDAPTGEDGDSPGEADDPSDDHGAPSDGGAQLTPDDLLEALATRIDDPQSSDQWALADINAYGAWDLARCEGSVTVAVMDTGFDVSHEDLADNMLPGFNATDESTDVSPYGMHGTHVAGIISAVANNGVGVAGVSYNAKILPIKVFDSEGRSYTSVLVKAYEQLLSSGTDARVVNLSLGLRRDSGFKTNDLLLEAKINQAYDEGIITVAAAGNGSLGEPPFGIMPGDFTKVVSVINIDASHKRNESGYEASNYNVTDEDLKNVSAPGTEILSTELSNGYGTLTGTSMSAPCVAGVLALEFAAEPALTPEEAVGILYGSTDDIGEAGWDRETGWGKVNALAAVASVKGIPKITQSMVSLSQTTFTYDGTAHRPQVQVALDGNVLRDGVDYEVSYLNNVEAGTASVVVTGIGTYKGVATKTFTIARADISSARVAVSPAEQVYSGSEFRPQVKVTLGSTKLTAGTDYTLTYKGNVNVGKGRVVVSGHGNYTGKAEGSFHIRFVDVPADHWAYKKVHEAAELGLVRGYSDEKAGYFGPSDKLTRAQVVVILWRMAGQPDPKAGAKEFGDVAVGAYYHKAVLWASSTGVVHGFGDGSFGPNKDITREQLAVMLANYMRYATGKKAAGSKADYASMSDASSVSAYAEKALGWCFKNQILTGTTDGKIMPQGSATRAQAAKMMVMLYGLLP